MNTEAISALVTGGASGLGLATVRRLLAAGASVVIADLASGPDPQFAHDPGLGERAHFVRCDVGSTTDLDAALDFAESLAPLRVLVHCAGRGGPVRLVEKDGAPGSLAAFEDIVRVNLLGSFNTLRLTAARMARNALQDGERGVCVLTASVAAFEGQIGQVAYAASKAGVVGMTLVAARELARHQIRVCTIAPGIFDTPMLARLPQTARQALAAAVPHPARLGQGDEYARLALHIVGNPMLNGETIRLDGALRMGPR